MARVVYLVFVLIVCVGCGSSGPAKPKKTLAQIAKEERRARANNRVGTSGIVVGATYECTSDTIYDAMRYVFNDGKINVSFHLSNNPIQQTWCFRTPGCDRLLWGFPEPDHSDFIELHPSKDVTDWLVKEKNVRKNGEGPDGSCYLNRDDMDRVADHRPGEWAELLQLNYREQPGQILISTDGCTPEATCKDLNYNLGLGEGGYPVTNGGATFANFTKK